MRKKIVYALKVAEQYAKEVYQSMKEGQARFGWSYVETADLRQLKGRYETNGWESLTDDEQKCYQDFLLELQPGDYVVYINVPEWGRCTLARVDRPYFWQWRDKDFNHRIGVEPGSVRDFDRNAKFVHPALSARLKLQGRKWRIYADDEFDMLLEELAQGSTETLRTPDDQVDLLAQELGPHLSEMTKCIHHTHPSASLERLLARIFRQIPAVREVIRQGGAGDHGADLIVVVESTHPLTGKLQSTKCVVQVKSFEGDHWCTRAVEDIDRALARYPDADEGLIVSTADRTTDALEDALETLRERSGKQINLLIGEEVAAFVLKYGWETLRSPAAGNE